MQKVEKENKNDFSKGSISKHIVSLAIPMTMAQLVQMLYNIIDRIYIGHLPGESFLALTGLGLTFPIIMLIVAFTNLFGMGGTPLFSIARGKRDEKKAEKIMGNTFSMLCISSIILIIISYVFMKPVLYLFGASDASYPYAHQYLMIYLIGTPFVMIGTGMNGFINAQGFAKVGMVTIMMGAVVNIILDPIFIFLLGMGVSGAALATVISQLLSAIWVMRFLIGDKTLLKITRESMKIDKKILKRIINLGMAGFIMAASNSAVQIACNSMLKGAGGDIYVGVMTVLISVRDVVSSFMHGLTSAAQPVLGFNYGAREFKRIKTGIIFLTVVTVVYITLTWVILLLFPEPIMSVFTSDAELIAKGVPASHIYFFGYFMMAFQMAGQSVFVGLGQSKQAIFFSLLRKIVIVVPLTLILPNVANLGVNGVFLAEPVSNFIGGAACYATMIFTVKRIFRENRNLFMN